MSRWIIALVLSSWTPLLAGQAPPIPGFGEREHRPTPQSWNTKRAAILKRVVPTQYGEPPSLPASRETNRKTEVITFPGGRVTKVTATLLFGPDDALVMEVGCMMPAGAGPHPAVLAIEPVWWPNPFLKHGIVQRLATNGYAFAGFNHNALASYEDPGIRPAQDAYPDADWGVVAVAAWGAQITLSWLESLEGIDAGKVGVWGHSRRGKSALLAGATDERFAAVMPHMAGMAGGAMYRIRNRGAQELEQLKERFWLHRRMFTFIDRETAIPFDQHWLLASVAPRSLLVVVGRDDAWGNPRGERAAFEAARGVFSHFDCNERMSFVELPTPHVDPNGPTGGSSWDAVVRFLDRQFGRARKGVN